MHSATDFIPSPYSHSIENGVFEFSSPSNIALVKYWGKKDNQIPANPSVSFTLNTCKTITKLAFAKKIMTEISPLTYFLKENQKKISNLKFKNFWKELRFICRFWKNFILQLTPKIRFHIVLELHRQLREWQLWRWILCK